MNIEDIMYMFDNKWNADKLGVTMEELEQRKIWNMEYANKHALDWVRPDFWEDGYVDYLREEIKNGM